MQRSEAEGHTGRDRGRGAEDSGKWGREDRPGQRGREAEAEVERQWGREADGQGQRLSSRIRGAEVRGRGAERQRQRQRGINPNRPQRAKQIATPRTWRKVCWAEGSPV